MSTRRHAIVYISYEGMLEPLGQSQVLAYQEHLARDYQVHLLSFEKCRRVQDDPQYPQLQSRMQAAGIRWHPRRYHKTPSALATAWDILTGMVVTTWLVLR